MKPATWRRWHRWIGFAAALFLLFAASTGIAVAATEFFGEEERLREATRDLVSPVTLGSPEADWAGPVARGIATARAEAGDAPIDKITVMFKGEQPTVSLFLGRPEGGEDRRIVVDARNGDLIEVASYVDKPLIKRIHSGEAFGDGGLWVAMGWGLALACLTISGFVIYWRMRRPGATGWKKVFW